MESIVWCTYLFQVNVECFCHYNLIEIFSVFKHFALFQSENSQVIVFVFATLYKALSCQLTYFLLLI